MSEFSNFYTIFADTKKTAATVDNKKGFFLDAYKFCAGEEEPKSVPIYKIKHGRDVYDLVSTTYAIVHLISRKFKILLEKNKFSGWKAYPVKLYNRKDEEIPGYYVIQITGKCGPVNSRKAKTVYVEYPGGIFKEKKGLYFNLKSWDGSDLFMPKGSAHIIITSKVKEELEKSDISNVEFIPLTEYIL